MMSNNVETMSKLTKELEKLLKSKQAQYGSFDNTSFAMKGILESILAAHNGHKVRVPNNIFGCFMQFLKIWRSITNPMYKKDTYDDVNGYNELNRMLKIKETEDE